MSDITLSFEMASGGDTDDSRRKIQLETDEVRTLQILYILSMIT